MEHNRVLRRTGEAPAVRVYTVCDESRYLIVRNVPSLNCENELLDLFGTCGTIEAYRRLDEEREPFTEIYWIKFDDIADARLAKRKLDDFKFFSNLLQVSYAPTYETVGETKDKLEERRSAVLDRKAVLQGTKQQHLDLQFFEEQDPLLSAFVPARPVVSEDAPDVAQDAASVESSLCEPQPQARFPQTVSYERTIVYDPKPLHFEDATMNQTAQLVRKTLEKVSSVTAPGSESQKRRRI